MEIEARVVLEGLIRRDELMLAGDGESCDQSADDDEGFTHIFYVLRPETLARVGRIAAHKKFDAPGFDSF